MSEALREYQNIERYTKHQSIASAPLRGTQYKIKPEILEIISEININIVHRLQQVFDS